MSRHYSVGTRAKAGLVAGVVAGVAMAMVAMIRAAMLGMGLWLPPKLIAGVFWGVEVLIGGAVVILAGLMLHMVISGGAGMMLGAALGDRLSAVTAMLGGLVLAIVMWAVMTWGVLPWANEVMLERQMVAPGWWFIYHLVFGFMLFLIAPLARAFGGSREPAEPVGAEPVRG